MKEKVTTIQKRSKKSVQRDSVLYITPKGDTWKEHKLYIEDFAEDLYEFLRKREEKVKASPTMTSAFATFVSEGFQFEDFSCEEVRLPGTIATGWGSVFLKCCVWKLFSVKKVSQKLDRTFLKSSSSF